MRDRMGRKVHIDGPAGRNEVTDKFRTEWDRIFNGTDEAQQEETTTAQEKEEGSHEPEHTDAI